MKTKLLFPTLLILATVLFACTKTIESESLKIDFIVSMEDPGSHYYQVELNCTGLSGDQVEFKLPAWTPGYYRVLDLAQHIVDFSSTDADGDSLDWKKTAKNAWTVTTEGSEQVHLKYFVYANRRSVAEPYLDTVKGFICPTGVFMHVEGMKDNPVSVTIVPCKPWNTVSTGLKQMDPAKFSFTAKDFDELYDCPILVGNQTVVEFSVEDIPHRVAIENAGDADFVRLKSDLERIVVTSTDLMGEIPYEKYEFLVMEQGGGGLEHRNSMAVYSNIAGYPGTRSQLGWLGFMAHEYFHLFNVKTIRPFVLGPFDYDKENLTPMLWFSEGGTVYYQEIILNRGGFTNADQFLMAMERNLKSHENISGHLFQSAAQSSWDTWINFFSRSQNSQDVTINYYSKGCTLSMLLDLAIRHESKNKKSLDDVMRILYYDYHKTKNRGFTDAEFRKECEIAAGSDLSEFFDLYVATTADIDYEKYLAYAGLQIDLSPEGEPKEVLGKTFQKRSFAISRMTEMDELQKEIYEGWVK